MGVSEARLLIVMKFGGSSVADASRILAVCDIVRSRRDRRPVVVVSALAGVTDLLVRAVHAAGRGDREGIEPLLAEVERKHRWAVTGAVEDPRRRHDLSLALDALFEELRQLLRAVRILGEETPRASDALLAFGELLSARIAVAALAGRGVPARLVDPREVLVTNDRHGAAEPDVEAVAARASEHLLPALEVGDVPVIGGFVGATADGRTTTLGRGGSDTSAAVLGAALGAEEIQIWTDVDGLMTADPNLVPEARTLPRVTFAEAAELAFYGAKVLHPASIAPAMSRRIPVRVLNTLRPEAAGTLILEGTEDGSSRLVSVASRGGVSLVRVTSRRMRVDPGFLLRVLGALAREEIVPDLVVSSEVGVTAGVGGEPDVARLRESLAAEAEVSFEAGKGIVCVVGSVLAREPAVRTRVLEALGAIEPEVVALGGAGTSVAAVVAEARLGESARTLHRRFLEGDGRASA